MTRYLRPLSLTLLALCLNAGGCSSQPNVNSGSTVDSAEPKALGFSGSAGEPESPVGGSSSKPSGSHSKK